MITIDLKCKVDPGDIVMDEEEEGPAKQKGKHSSEASSELCVKQEEASDDDNEDNSKAFKARKREAAEAAAEAKAKRLKLPRGEKVPVEEMRRMVETCAGSFFPVRTNKNAFAPGKKKDR